MDIFLVFGCVGLCFLLFSVLFDGTLDALHLDVLDNDFLSLVTINTFLSIFGFAGYGFRQMGLTVVVVSFLAVLAGLAGAGIVGWFMRALKRSDQPDGAWSGERLVGTVGMVVEGALAGAYATIAVDFNGAPLHLGAQAACDLFRGEQVRVLQTLSDTAVLVEPVELER